MEKHLQSPPFIISYVFYLGSLISLYKGLHKMLVYKNSDSVLIDPINAYVGGDAYNYIINANYTTSFFVLALFFAFMGFVIQWNTVQIMKK